MFALMSHPEAYQVKYLTLWRITVQWALKTRHFCRLQSGMLQTELTPQCSILFILLRTGAMLVRATAVRKRARFRTGTLQYSSTQGGHVPTSIST